MTLTLTRDTDTSLAIGNSLLACFQVGGILLLIFGSIGAANQDATINMLNLDANFWMIENTGFNVLPYIEGVAIYMIVLGSILILSTILGSGGVVAMKERTGKVVCMCTCARTCVCGSKYKNNHE